MKNAVEEKQENELWDVPRAAKWGGLTEAGIYRLVAEGRIPHLRIGSRLRFDPKELDRWARRRGGGRP